MIIICVLQIIFQSTPPVRGGTRATIANHIGAILFQSTHPVRGGTDPCVSAIIKNAFQSTHPVRGGTFRL